MFEVCFDEGSVSRLALVWRPDRAASEPVREPLADKQAANLLFSVLDHQPWVPAKPARRRRKAPPKPPH